MPANLSPEYKKAEQAFRAARDERDRLACLKEMLRTIPKHKGTEHLQADIKSRIKQLSDELSGPKKGGTRVGPVHVIRSDGAAQVALLGPPNAGKSRLHAELTGSRAGVGPYPHTTHAPLPGMLPFEDVHFQLIDLPPITTDFIEPWIVNALQPADAALVVVDIADPECTDQLDAVIEQLRTKKITLTGIWPADAQAVPAEPDDEEIDADPFRIELPALLIANKSDLNASLDDIAVLKELTGIDLPAIAVSAQTREGLDGIGAFLFDKLGIVRVYTKAPGKEPEMDRPFTLRRGDTVLDVARQVHKDVAAALRYARAWGRDVFDGQQVGPEHAVADGDVVELHMR